MSRLYDSNLIRQGQFKEYYLKLSEIVRRYLERRFEILAVESTTFEILRDLQHKETASTVVDKARDVLEYADLVKFAKLKPAPAEIIRINQTAKAMVEEARPSVAMTPEGTPQ